MSHVKISDFVASFIKTIGVDDVFLISGGSNMHLIDSIGRHKGLRYVCTHHEQAAAMAAEAYARVRESLGVVVTTTGPSATNAITGVAGAWLDSTPMLVISGQVKTSNTIGSAGTSVKTVNNSPRVARTVRYLDSDRGSKMISQLRQFGVQELPIIDLVRPITKYAVMVRDAKSVRFHLEEAAYMAREGRPGPAWVDIPLDIQGAMINTKSLSSYKTPISPIPPISPISPMSIQNLLKKAKRPVLLAGNGIRLAQAQQEFLTLVDRLGIPVLTGWNANDLIHDSHPLFMGRPGSFGQRHANLIMQNSDFLLAIGARLSVPQMGYDFDTFARGAKKIAVDIDLHELAKPSLKNFDLKIQADASEFIRTLLHKLNSPDFPHFPNRRNWLTYCNRVKKKYPVVLPEYKRQKKYVNSYYFVDILCDALTNHDVVVTDMGTSFTCTAQAFRVKRGQRYFTSSGLASMGFGLPGAIGACIGNGRARTVCITGDGGLQMNIQELQTVIHYNLPIKIFVLYNAGYLTIRGTQDNFFEGFHVGSDKRSGVSCPDTIKVAKAYGFKTLRISTQRNLLKKIKSVLKTHGPVVCEIMMDPDQPLIPRLTSVINKKGQFVSKPLEDMYPFLPRDEFRKNMLVKPVSDELKARSY